MSTKTGLFAGLLGAFGITLITAFGRWLGLEINFELLLGTLLIQDTSVTAWLIGLFMHLGAGAAFGAAYAQILARAAGGPSALSGAVIGTVHGFLSGVLIAAMPVVHPTMPEVIAAPGMFMIHYGYASTLVFVGLHILFGAFVGGFGAREPLRRRRSYRRLYERHA